MKNSKKIWIAVLALMAFTAVFETVKSARADDPVTPTTVKKPGQR